MHIATPKDIIPDCIKEIKCLQGANIAITITVTVISKLLNVQRMAEMKQFYTHFLILWFFCHTTDGEKKFIEERAFKLQVPEGKFWLILPFKLRLINCEEDKLLSSPFSLWKYFFFFLWWDYNTYKYISETCRIIES